MEVDNSPLVSTKREQPEEKGEKFSQNKQKKKFLVKFQRETSLAGGL